MQPGLVSQNGTRDCLWDFHQSRWADPFLGRLHAQCFNTCSNNLLQIYSSNRSVRVPATIREVSRRSEISSIKEFVFRCRTSRPCATKVSSLPEFLIR